MLESSFRIDAASIAGSVHENQDAWGMREPVFWVLDGATAPPSNDGLTVGDFVAALGDAIYQHANPAASLHEILRAALETITTHPATQAGFTATVAMAKHTLIGWEWLVLCDAAVIFKDPEAGFHIVTDLRLQDSGTRRNVPGGFWVAGAVPEAAGFALQGTVSGSTRISLCTDGVVDGLTRNHWPSVEAAVADWETHGVEASISRMRQQLYERCGIVDDATLLSIGTDV